MRENFVIVQSFILVNNDNKFNIIKIMVNDKKYDFYKLKIKLLNKNTTTYNTQIYAVLIWLNLKNIDNLHHKCKCWRIRSKFRLS